MTVDQNSAAPRSLFVVRPNHRMTRGGTKFGGETNLIQLFHESMAALSYLFRVLIVRRDAGEAEELIKSFDMTCTPWWTLATQQRLSSRSKRSGVEGYRRQALNVTPRDPSTFARDDSSGNVSHEIIAAGRVCS